MRILVGKESGPGERRVALTPEVAKRLIEDGHQVSVEQGAGQAAGIADALWMEAGARMGSFPDLQEGSEVLLQVLLPDRARLEALPPGLLLVCLAYPERHLEEVGLLRERRVDLLALDLIPRITRAQAMDVLSSMSTVAGYRAALLAAVHLDRFFPMLMTAAGTIPPARVLVLGAGVAGLQAIATARRLGAVVEAFDLRAAAREQARSLGAEAFEVALEESGEGSGGYAAALSSSAEEQVAREIGARARRADAVIATALVPGRAAPRLLGDEDVAAMRPGAVIVDLAAPAGGNCALTRPGEIVRTGGGVTIVGLLDLASQMPLDASRMLARNLQAVITQLLSDAERRLRIDLDDEIMGAALLVHEGTIRRRDLESLVSEGSSA